MIKKIILASALMALTSASFAATTTTPLSSMAHNVVVSAQAVDGVIMGPLGQVNPSAGQISTEVKMNITNNAKTPAKLIAVSSPVAKEVQLHKTIEKNGQTAMRQIPSVEIKAQTTDDLSYQGVHIMLIGLKKPIVKGETIPLNLIFADGSQVRIKAEVV